MGRKQGPNKVKIYFNGTTILVGRFGPHKVMNTRYTNTHMTYLQVHLNKLECRGKVILFQ